MARRSINRLPLMWVTVSLLFGAQAGATDDNPAITIGRDIYELARGQNPITVQFEGGEWMPATQGHACRSCHGDSGEGASEGTIAAPALPPLAATAGKRWPNWLDNALLRHQALDGQPLNAAMPRYRLSPSDKAMLGSYLRALPHVEVPGLSANSLAIGVAPEQSGLGPAGEQLLFAELDKLALTVNGLGGIFGRRVQFTRTPTSTAALIDLAWRADNAPRTPTLSVQGPATAQSIGLACGSLDPGEAQRARTLADWSQRQGRPAIVAGEAPATAGTTVVVAPHASILPADLVHAATVYAPADIAKRWGAAVAPDRLRIYAPGDMGQRAATARLLIDQHGADPRDAMVTAVYLEGASLILTALENSGRRIRRASFCDTVRTLSRSRRVLSVMTGDNVAVVPVSE